MLTTAHFTKLEVLYQSRYSLTGQWIYTVLQSWQDLESPEDNTSGTSVKDYLGNETWA